MAASLLSDEADVESNVVGLVRVPGNVGTELMKRIGASTKNDVDAVVEGEDDWRRLQSKVQSAARGDLVGGIETHTLNTVDSADAANADLLFGRMLKDLKEQAATNGKTVVLHLVVEDSPSLGRRLQDEDNAAAEGDSSSSYSSNQKSMNEIQSFNLYLWTSVGLFVIVYMVMSAFIGEHNNSQSLLVFNDFGISYLRLSNHISIFTSDMPLFPDTLLFGEIGVKSGSD
jgi:hypothetical protein